MSPSIRPLPSFSFRPTSFVQEMVSCLAGDDLERLLGNAESLCVDIQNPGNNVYPWETRVLLLRENVLVHHPTVTELLDDEPML